MVGVRWFVQGAAVGCVRPGGYCGGRLLRGCSCYRRLLPLLLPPPPLLLLLPVLPLPVVLPVVVLPVRCCRPAAAGAGLPLLPLPLLPVVVLPVVLPLPVVVLPPSLVLVLVLPMPLPVLPLLLLLPLLPVVVLPLPLLPVVVRPPSLVLVLVALLTVLTAAAFTSLRTPGRSHTSTPTSARVSLALIVLMAAGMSCAEAAGVDALGTVPTANTGEIVLVRGEVVVFTGLLRGWLS